MKLMIIFIRPVSDVFTYTLLVDGKEQEVHNLSSPIIIRIPITRSANNSDNYTGTIIITLH